MRRPFSSWTRTFTALGFKLKKRKGSKPTRQRGRKTRLESLESRMMLAATTLDVFVAGRTGEEVLTLQIDGENVQSWTDIGGDFDNGVYEQISYPSPDTVTADQIRLVFTNDGFSAGGVDRDLRIDGISVAGQFFESESPGVASEGSWGGVNDCGFGFKQSEYLNCEDGYFQYALGWSAGLFVVDTATDEDDGDYSLGDRSLREALSLATGTGSHQIEFDASLAGAVIKLTEELHPTGNVEIVGLGSEQLTIDAQGTAANPRRAFLIDSAIDVTLDGLTITGGSADRGGAIHTVQGDLLLQQVVLRENQATNEGGGIYQSGGELEVFQSTIEKNTAQYGGGIFAKLGENEKLDVVESSLLRNVAQHVSFDSAAGAIYVAGQPVSGATTAGEVLLFESTIAHNLSQTTEGALGTDHHTGGVLLSQVEHGEIIHSTFSSNTASNTSGGLNLVDSGTVDLINTTIAFNEVAGAGSGGLTISGGSVVTVANTIVAENRASGSRQDVAGSFSSASTRNLLSSAPNPGGSHNTLLLNGEDAGLVPLADNGGGTLTHAILPSSSAVDGGSDSRTYDPGNTVIKDQRGYRRQINFIPGPTAGIVDIGAYELQPQVVSSADFNGDGRADQVFFDPASGNLDVLADVGLRHTSSSWGHLLPPVGNANWNQFQTGDFNGDGRDDLAAYNATAGEWTIALSDGNQFVFHPLALGTPDDHWQIGSVGDFDGDGSDELIGRTHLSGSWQVLHFDEQAGASLEDWGHSFGGYTDWTVFVGDFDQDGRDDLIARRPFVPGNWYAVRSQAASNATGDFSGSIGLSKSLDPYFHAGNFTVANFDAQFHRNFADDPNSIDVEGPFQDVLDRFSAVYNEIEVEFYDGLKKGPQATRETLAGNPWDQAALLVEDLLAAGFQAEIVSGKIAVPDAEFMEWVGTLEVAAAAGIIQLSLDPNFSYHFDGGEIFATFRHAWVRVNLPTATGLGWFDLDPSWKFKDRQPGIKIQFAGPRGTFDEFAYFADPQDQLPIEYYEDLVADYLASNGINASLADVAYDGPIRRRQFDSIPVDDRLAKAANVQSKGTFSHLVANDARDYTHRIRLSVGTWNRDIVVPESSLSNFTFRRDLSSLTFFVDGVPEVTVGLPAGGADLEVTHAVPGEAFAASSRVYSKKISNSGPERFYTFSFDANQQSSTSLDNLREKLISAATDGITTDDIRAVLDYAGARYWYETTRIHKQSGALTNSIPVQSVVNSGLIEADVALEVGNFGHLQTPIVPKNMTLDIGRSNSSLVDIRFDSAAGSELYLAEGIQLTNYSRSALEHATIEEVINTPGISTIRGLKNAYQGDPFFTGLPSNSIFVLDSVLEGSERKIYLRGEIGNRADENGYLPYEVDRVDTLVTSAQALRDLFPSHKLNPSGANDDQNNPSITTIWTELSEDVDGDAFTFVPWAHSYVGESQQYWRGSVYYIKKQSISDDSGGGFLIQGEAGGPPLNGGRSSQYVIPRNPFLAIGASIYRNFAGDPVDVLNGNMFRDELDIAMPNVGVPLDFSRHYNSQSNYNVGLGAGWTHSFSDRLLQEAGESDKLTWLTSEGVRHVFSKIAGVWNSPTVLLGQLQETSGGYVYFESDGIEHHFQSVTPSQASGTENYIARLAQIVDREGHGVELEYANSSLEFLPTRVRDVHFSSRRLELFLSGGNHVSSIRKYNSGLVGTWNYEYLSGGTQLSKVTNPEQESVVFEYHNSGLTQNVLSRITEADGAYHAYEYYPNGRTFRVKEGVFDGTNYREQSSHSFSYDLLRNRTEFTDENGNLETYLHQEDGRLVRQIHEDRSRTVTTWGVEDGAGGIVTDTETLMRSQTDENGAIESFEYFLGETGTNAFKNRRLKRATGRHFPGETPFDTEYNYTQATASNHLVNVAAITVDPGGSDPRSTAFQYDSQGRLEQISNAINEVTEFDYYADDHPSSHLRGLRLSETRASNAGGSGPIETTFTYDNAGLVTSNSTNNLPASTTTYHHTGLPEIVTDATGVATQFSYDTLGRRTSTTLLGDLANPSDDLVSNFTYDERGRLIESIDALGHSTSWIYDRRGNVTQQTKADGSQVEYEYDAAGNRIASIDALGRVTRFAYDSRNRLIQTLHPDGATERTRYDDVGRISTTNDALGHETRFEYDVRGLLISTTTAASTTDEASTTNLYNPFGELTQSVDGLGNVTQFVRDKLGRVTKTLVLDKLDNATPSTPTHTPVSVTTLDYDANGNIIQHVTYNVAELSGETTTLLSDDPRTLVSTHPQHVQTIETEYDVFNRPTETVSADNTSVRIEYDDAGRIRFQTNELNRVTEQNYGAYGRLVASIAPDPDGPSNPLVSPVTQFEYDAVGNQRAIIDARGNRTEYTFDALGRNIAIFDAEGGQTQTLYDTAGQLVATVDALGRATHTLFDQRGRATLVRTADPDKDGPEQASKMRFQYDAAGNRISETDRRGVTTTFEYDAQNRLTRVLEPDYILLSEIVDDGDTNFRIVTDTFPIESQTTGFAGDSQFITVPTSQAKATARWQFLNLEPGKYRVLATWDSRPDATTNANATISDAIPNLVISGLDQSKTPDELIRTVNGVTRGWVKIVTDIEVTAASSRNLKVVLSSENGSNLIADAVRLERLVENRFEYDSNGNRTAAIDTLDRQTDFTYDELQRLTTTMLPDPDGVGGLLPRPLTTLEYDGYGNLLRTIEHRGGQNREQVSSYDQRNRVVTETRDANASSNEQVTTSYGYDPVGNLVHRIEATGEAEQAVTQFRYDRLDRLISEWYHTDETVLSDWQQAVISSYDTLGNLVTQIDRVRHHDAGQTLYRSSTTEFAYDKLNRQTSETADAEGSLAATTGSRYDAVGNLVQSTDALGQITQHEYDRQNRRTKTTDPDPDGSRTTRAGATKTFTYDPAGNLLSQTNGAGEVTSSVYDSRERIISTFDALNAETRLVFDTEDNLISYLDPTGNETTNSYDALNRLTAESIDVNGTAVSRLYTYDAQGNLAEATDRNGRPSTFEYDRLDRRRYERWLDGSAAVINTLEWQYDALGRVVLQSDDVSIETFDYDNLGRVTAARNYDPAASTSAQPRVEQRWDYDLLDPADFDEFVRSSYSQHQIDQATQLGQTTHVTDRLGRTSQLVDTAGTGAAKQINFSYDRANQLSHVTRSGNNGNFNFGTDYRYDHTGRIEQFSHFTLQASPLTSYSYQYDLADRITAQTTEYDTTIAALSLLGTNQTEDFTFDGAGQLTADAGHTYVYDDNGNRTDSGSVITANNRLAADADFTYTYDNEGNRTRRDSQSDNSYTLYTWDPRNRLTEVIDFDNAGQSVNTVEYRYNAENQLVAKTAASSTQHYLTKTGITDRSERALELANNGNLRRRTLWAPVDDALLVDEVFDTTGQLQQTLWAATDHAGSVRQLLDLNENVVEHRTFDSFGTLDEAFDETGALIGVSQLRSTIGFTGKHFDADAALQNSNARWYDPKVGRFLSEDPISFAKGAGRYCFVAADPQGTRVED